MEFSDSENEKMREDVFKHQFMPYRPLSWFREPGHLKFIVKGEGVRVTDSEGKTYLDGAAGWQFGAVGIGICLDLMLRIGLLKIEELIY